MYKPFCKTNLLLFRYPSSLEVLVALLKASGRRNIEAPGSRNVVVMEESFIAHTTSQQATLKLF